MFTAQPTSSAAEKSDFFPYFRLLLPLVIALIYGFDYSARAVITQALSDAYITVGVFVAVTLFAYYFAQKQFGFDINRLSERAPIVQIVIAAILGALPGCGGAIIVVSQYAAGQVGFAALVTVLVATMGDAAFLLLAKAPTVGLMVVFIGVVVGILSGLAVNAIHSPNFLRRPPQHKNTADACKKTPPIRYSAAMFWIILLLVVFPLTLLSAFQVTIEPLNVGQYKVDITLVLGVLGALLCMVMWAMLPLQNTYRSLVAEDDVALSCDTDEPNLPHVAKASPMVAKVVHDTNFIMVWVSMAFLCFELFVHYTGIDISGFFDSAAWLAPLIGVAVGFLPGCGPQIIVASLYLQGVAPLSTLLGNAISNDGDALFPAIALAPKAALYATIYSAIPAIIVGYAVFFWVG